jgi:hypothetical protein
MAAKDRDGRAVSRATMTKRSAFNHAARRTMTYRRGLVAGSGTMMVRV